MLGHWALATSQELPAWGLSCPLPQGPGITLSSSSRGRQCPERRGHQPKGRTARKWPTEGWTAGFSELCPEHCLPRGALGAWQRPEQTRWVEESSGSLWPAKSWYPQTVRNPSLLCLPYLPTLALLCVSFSVVSDLATPWTVACQAPLSMGFSRQEYSSGLPFPSPGDLFNPGTEPGSPTLQVVVLSGAQYTFLNKLLSLKQAN